jgi:hypothetical protein
MTPLTPEFIADAAFAFAVTLLVISFDTIPRTFDEMILAIKSIPAFIVAVVQLVWIWHTHSTWSQRFGLQTTWAVVLSTALLMVMLIYIYPLRIMAAGMFMWLSGGYFPSGFDIGGIEDLRAMFIFLGFGFVVLCMVFVLMYRYAASLEKELLLDEAELHETRTVQILWAGSAVIGVLLIVTAATFPDSMVPFSGMSLALLVAWFPVVRRWRSS